MEGNGGIFSRLDGDRGHRQSVAHGLGGQNNDLIISTIVVVDIVDGDDEAAIRLGGGLEIILALLFVVVEICNGLVAER